MNQKIHNAFPWSPVKETKPKVAGHRIIFISLLNKSSLPFLLKSQGLESSSLLHWTAFSPFLSPLLELPNASVLIIMIMTVFCFFFFFFKEDQEVGEGAVPFWQRYLLALSMPFLWATFLSYHPGSLCQDSHFNPQILWFADLPIFFPCSAREAIVQSCGCVRGALTGFEVDQTQDSRPEFPFLHTQLATGSDEVLSRAALERSEETSSSSPIGQRFSRKKILS